MPASWLSQVPNFAILCFVWEFEHITIWIFRIFQMCQHLQWLLERCFHCSRNEQMNLQEIDYVLVWLEKWALWHFSLFDNCHIHNVNAAGSPHPLHIRLLIVFGLFKKRNNLGFSPLGAKIQQWQELVNPYLLWHSYNFLPVSWTFEKSLFTM